MNAAGVDVSKGKSMVSVLRPLGQVVAKPFEVRHTGKGLRELAKYLKSLEGETRVVMEQTGRYYEPSAQYLCEAGIFVSAVNPELIKDYGNNSLRKVKTDKADSRKIAKYALDNWAELRQYTSMDKTRYQLNVLNRQCSYLTADRTAQKNSLTAILDMTYPGANQSGAYETKRSLISKRGSPELRRTLFLVMDLLLKTGRRTTRCTSLWTGNSLKANRIWSI